MKRPLILASKSPRRSQLLTEAGIKFTIKTREIEETYPAEMAVEEVPAFLAIKKAKGAADFIIKDEIILTCDTIVLMDNIIYGKPKDYDDAIWILKMLSGRMHYVISGVCLMAKEKQVVFSEKTEVYIDPMTEAEIRYYLDEYKPFDKAGSYGIQDWLGVNKIGRINGSYCNVVGLPVSRVAEELRKF